MRYIDDHEAQIGEELKPVGMMWQDSRVEHIGVAEHDTRLLWYRGSGGWGGVAVLDRGA
jgi:hypothetical protein